MDKLDIIEGEFVDSATYNGWHNINKVLGKEPNVKFSGIKIAEDDTYIIIAQAEKHPFYGNILKIPKVSILSVAAIAVLILIILLNHDIKSSILAMLP